MEECAWKMLLAAPPRRIAGTPTHGYEPTLKGVMAAFANSWRRE
jgi:hypothetical protein